jgi:hypothetical protein
MGNLMLCKWLRMQRQTIGEVVYDGEQLELDHNGSLARDAVEQSEEFGVVWREVDF